jgi:hypothetical protein
MIDDINWDIPAAEARMARNVAETGAPFHHKTANGAIVDQDPRLSRDYLLEYYWYAGIPVTVPKPWKRPKSAVHLIADWYSTKAGTAWLRKHSTAQVIEAAPLQRSLW